MSLALSFLGGMAKRGMQLNDERRAIDQQIELKTKLTEIENKAAMRRASAARNQKRQEDKEAALSTWKALGGNLDESQIEWAASQTPELRQIMLDQVAAGKDISALIMSRQIVGDDGIDTTDYYLDTAEVFKKKDEQAATVEAELNRIHLKAIDPNISAEERERYKSRIPALLEAYEALNPKDTNSNDVSLSELWTMRNQLSRRKVKNIDTGVYEERKFDVQGTGWVNSASEMHQGLSDITRFATETGRIGQSQVTSIINIDTQYLNNEMEKIASKYRTEKGPREELIKFKQVPETAWADGYDLENNQFPYLQNAINDPTNKAGMYHELYNEDGIVTMRILFGQGQAFINGRLTKDNWVKF